jgi:putative MATE family efflux protein
MVGVQAIWIALWIAAIAAPVLAVGAEPLCRLLGAEGDVLGFAVTYLRISAIGVPFVLLGLAVQGVQRGASDYRTPLVVLIAANVVNVVVELVLVVGLELGVAGAAWSTVIAQTGAGLVLAATARRHLAARPSWRPVREEMGPLLTAGRHLLLRVGAMLAVFTGATAVAARIDEPTLAAHQVANSVFLFLALSLDALAVPAQTLVAEELGRDRPGVAAEVADRVVVLSLRVGAALALALALASPLVARLFSTDPAVVDRTVTALLFLAAVMLPGALAFGYDGVLIGAADFAFLGRAALGYLVAVAPLAAVVLAAPGLGIAGLWSALLVWMCLRAAVNRHRAHHLLPRSPHR